jgi:hypothetical protein
MRIYSADAHSAAIYHGHRMLLRAVLDLFFLAERDGRTGCGYERPVHLSVALWRGFSSRRENMEEIKYVEIRRMFSYYENTISRMRRGKNCCLEEHSARGRTRARVE